MSRHPVFIEDGDTPMGRIEELADKRSIEPVTPASDANPDASVPTSVPQQNVSNDDATGFGAADPLPK